MVPKAIFSQPYELSHAKVLLRIWQDRCFFRYPLFDGSAGFCLGLPFDECGRGEFPPAREMCPFAGLVLEEAPGGGGGEVAKVEVACSQQGAVPVPHFFL